MRVGWLGGLLVMGHLGSGWSMGWLVWGDEGVGGAWGGCLGRLIQG